MRGAVGVGVERVLGTPFFAELGAFLEVVAAGSAKCDDLVLVGVLKLVLSWVLGVVCVSS